MESEKQAERQRADELQAALKKAAEYNTAPTRKSGADAAPKDDDVFGGDEPPVDRAEGTHEYECTKCGYTMFPAAGREFKFYGDDFKCPGCGADKSAFVDNGVVEV